MPRQLPERPNLEQLKKQAKSLLAAVKKRAKASGIPNTRFIRKTLEEAIMTRWR